MPKTPTCIIICFFLLLSPAEGRESSFIPAGPFHMGSEEGVSHERPVHEVFIDDFHMDRFPVTNAEYARFLNVFGNRVEEGEKWLDTDSVFSWWLCNIKKVNGRFFPRSGYENHPVVKVSWYGARAYARWLGKRLPTEAEWEKAARGGLAGQRYVYGNSIDSTQANVGGLGRTQPVGTYPSNGFGVYDMVAGVWQWCSDWYDPGYYQRSPYRNPQGPERGVEKVLRGGSWYHRDSWRVAVRGSDVPLSWSFCFVTGFRCVRDAEKRPQRYK